MATRKTGIANDAQFFRESDSTEVTGDLGLIRSISWTINLSEEPRSSVGQAPTLQAAIQQMAEVSISIDLEPSGLEAFKLQGTYTDNGDGTYDVSLDDKLPEFTAKLQVTDSDDNLEITGIKFLTATLTVRDGQPVELTFDGQGKDAKLLDETINTPTPSSPSQWLDAHLELGGSSVASVDSAQVVYDRSEGQDTGPQRGLTNANAADRIQPDEIIEGNKFFNFDTTVNVTDKQAFDETFNSSNQPYGLEDATARTTAKLVLNNGDDNFHLTDAKITENSGELTDDAGEVQTVDLSGNSFTASITGST